MIARQTAHVDIQDVRRKALRHQLEGPGTSVNAFAKRIGKSQPLLADVLRGEKGFGERLARDIEKRAGWTIGVLDREPGSQVAEPMIRYGLPISPDAVDMGREWDKLHEPIRTQLLMLVRTLIEAQGGGDRPKPRGKSGRGRRHDGPHDRPS